MKTCNECGDEKPLDAFYNHPACKMGRSAKCKECLRQKGRQRYAEKGKSIPLERELHNNAKCRAALKDVPFELSQNWVRDKLETGVCEVTGIPFGDRNTSFTPSLERVSPEKGYTEENTLAVVWIYNRAKGTGSHEDVVRLASALMEE